LARVLSTVFVIVLVAATGAAFGLTQHAKVELSPIYHTSVAKVFAPDCSCDTDTAFIDFRLRKRDRLQVWIEQDGKRVRTLVPGRTFPAGKVALVFNGLSDSGLALPDGVYSPVVHFGRSHRTIVLPNPIRLDTRPPVVHVAHPQRAVISPDGDGRKDVFRVRYRVTEPAHGILLVDHHQVVRTLRQRPEGELVWNGKLDGHRARPGNHLLEISAQDTAGNRAQPFPFAIVQIRYVALGRKRVVVRPGARFAIRVSADARTVRWLLHGRTGTARPGTLHLRAPRSPGVYRLYVSANGHAAKAAVVVG
jgi:hypothetical protein